MRAHDGSYITQTHTRRLSFKIKKFLVSPGSGIVSIFIEGDKMKFFILFALICVALCDTETDEVKEEENVVVVTTGNWDKVVEADKNVLVEFCE